MPRNARMADPSFVNRFPVRMIVLTAVLAAMASVLMIFDFPLPFLVPWLKLDASLVPAMFAGLTMGPLAGFLVVTIKNFVHMMVSSSLFIGELADWVIGSSLVLVASFIYLRMPTNKGLWLGALGGTLCMVVMGVLSNIFVMWPLYTKAFGLDVMLDMSKDAAPWVTDLGTYVAWAVLPFNLVKGMLISGLTLLLAKPLAPIIGMRRPKGRKHKVA